MISKHARCNSSPQGWSNSGKAGQSKQIIQHNRHNSKVSKRSNSPNKGSPSSAPAKSIVNLLPQSIENARWVGDLRMVYRGHVFHGD